jgi:hypothetical protein
VSAALSLDVAQVIALPPDYLGDEARIGSTAIGTRAYLVLVKGNPASPILDAGNMQRVFKDCIGYDSRKSSDSVKVGTVTID